MLNLLDFGALSVCCFMHLAPGWRGEGALDGPVGEAVMQRVLRYASFTSPILQGHRSSKVRHDPIRALVSVLRGATDPAHVAGFVIATVVDPVDLETRRGTTPNISQEIRERVTPPFTHRNAAPAPEVEVSGASLVTPGVHVAPRLVFLRLPATQGLAVGSPGHFPDLCSETPATFCVPASEALCRNG